MPTTKRMAYALRKVKTGNFTSVLGGKFTAKPLTLDAARLNGSTVAIAGHFYPGSITGDAAEVTNTGRPAAANYTSTSGGGGVTVVRSSGAAAGGGGGGVSAHALNDTGIHLGELDRSQAPWVADDIDADIATHTAIPGAHHAPVTAGAGITVSGQAVSVLLAANSGLGLGAGLFISAGNGIRISAGVTTVGLATDSGLTFSSGDLLLGTPGQVSATSTANVTAGTHNHSVQATANAKTTPAQLLKSDASGFLTTAKLTTDVLGADGILTITPTTRVDITAGKEIRTTDSVTGLFGAGYRLTNVSGHGLLDIREIQVEELRAYLFVADFVRVQLGETFLTKSGGVMYADMTTPAIGATATLIVEDVPFFSGALFANSEWVMLSLIDRSGGGLTIARAWGQVASYVDLGPDSNGVRRQQWTYTHRNGTVGLVYKKGSEVLGWGASGSSYIHSSVVDGAGSPYTRFATWSGANPYTPSNRTVHTQIGNLASITDTALNPTGFGLYGTNVFLKGKILAGNGNLLLDSNGMATVQSTSLGASNRLSFHWNTLAGTEVGFVGGRSFSGSDYQLMLSARGVSGSAWGTIALRANTAAQGLPQAVTLTEQGGVLLVQPVNVWVGPLFGMMISSNASLVTTTVPAGQLIVETIIADQLIADSISGTTMSGAEWEFAGNMLIDANSASTTTLTMTNQGAGRLNVLIDQDLSVGGALSVTGLINGVNVVNTSTSLATLTSNFNSHTANANAHHNQSHVLATAGALGGDHTVSGLTAGHVLKALTATTAGFAVFNHAELGNVLPDQHHAQAHVLATTSALGADHTVSGLTAGQVIKALTATTAAFTQLQHADLGGVTANQHHNQIHSTTGADHTIAGNALDLVGAAATNTLGLIVPSSNPGAAAAVLRTTTSGGLTLKTLAVQGNLDVTSGGDLTVGANILFVDASVGNVGINMAPDPQFDLDVLGSIRTSGFFVGRHAMQVKSALLIAHYDGQEPTATNATGEPTGHLGQVATIVGDVRYRYGKFGKAVECSEAATNLITNPQFDSGSSAGWTLLTGATAVGSRGTTVEDAYFGTHSYKVIKSGGAAADNYGIQTNISVISGQSYSVQCRVKVIAVAGGSQLVTLNVTNLNQSASVTGLTDGWQLLTVTGTASSTGTATVQVYVDNATTCTLYLDTAQAVNKAYQVPYTVGSRVLSYLAYGAVPVNWQRQTVMCWVKAAANRDSGTLIQRIWDIAADSTQSYTLFQQPGNTLRVSNGVSGQSVVSASAVDLTADWVHIAYVVNGMVAKLYVNAVEVASTTWSAVPNGVPNVYVGNRITGSDPFGGWIDELAIIDRVLPASEILAIVQSDAPVFAETSTFSFRVGASLVWGDNEGLFARDTDGTAAFAVVGVDGKSWGGVTLDKGDVMIGNSTSGYLQYDRSAARLALVDTDLTLLYGNAAKNKIKFVNGVNTIGEIYTYDYNLAQTFQLWAKDTPSATNDLILGVQDSAGNPRAYAAFFGSSFNVLANSAIINGSVTGITLQHQTKLRTSLIGYPATGAFWVNLVHTSTAAPASPMANSFVKFDQDSATATLAVLELRQNDSSEEFIYFNGVVSAGAAIDTAALGAYAGKIRISVNGTFRYIPYYAS